MTEIILTITITHPMPEPPMSDETEKPKPVLAKEQPLMCRCHVRYGMKVA